MTLDGNCPQCGADPRDLARVCGYCMDKKILPLMEKSKIQFPKCVRCGAELKWGDFAHEQVLCWTCFEQDVRDICAQLEELHPGLAEKVWYMFSLTAEVFGKLK